MCNPIVKWAGGKRQLIQELIKYIPKQYDRYFEPFFGGGALFFRVKPHYAVINDVNKQLINIYIQIRDFPEKIIRNLSNYQEIYNNFECSDKKSGFYYEMRDIYNEFISKDILNTESASLFIFLNKAGYNGLYRVNKNGIFNVPSAHRKCLKLLDKKNIYEISKLLQKCDIKSCDFEEACETIKTGDFVFFDSPYYGTFDNYQSGGFAEKDHIRLANLFKNLSEKGVYCLLTNNNCDFIKNLYQDFFIHNISVKRMINCDKNNRTGSEVIVTNFRN